MSIAPIPARLGAGESLACTVDAGFAEWMAHSGGSLAITTYQAGKLLMVGWNGAQVSFLPRQFDKPMGLDVLGNRMALATRHQVMLFASDAVLAHHYDQERCGRYDALYVPRVSYHTANLATHDLALTDDDVWFVNTRFSCLAGLTDGYNFTPRWKPPFITEIVPEDRCHLNGLAMANGAPAYVTLLGQSNLPGGWRVGQARDGLVMDVRTNQVVMAGLTMPHSPRWSQEALWVLNSGAGELLRWKPGAREPEIVCTLPAYLRGLCIVGHHALVGLCMIREQRAFGGMPVKSKFSRLLCGIAVVDTRRGQRIGLLEFQSGCTEIYDVRLIAGARRPNVLNLEKTHAFQAMSVPPDLHFWMRPDEKCELADSGN